MGCLDDSTIYDFAMGALGSDALATADEHIDSCEECRLLVVGLVQTTPPAVASGFDATQIGHGATLASDTHSAHAHATGRELVRGQVLGEKYVVLDVLGAGAMGIVYAAWDSGLERKVAIKTLRADAHWKDRKERFVREAQAMAKVAHPNVVAVHEVGEVGELAFIAMEFVEGRTLREWVQQEKRSWPAIRDMCVQAGRGLAAAHAAGLVHRDYKPENVLVGDDGRARVTDFGLVALGGSATEAQEKPENLLDLTLTGAVMGTPAYMAPEQFKAEAVDARTDQYAFCATTWEALVGVRPLAAKSFDAQLAMVLGGELPSPPAGIPRWLSLALLGGLAVDKEDRHVAMDTLLFALERDHRAAPGRRIAAGVAIAGLGIAAAMLLGRGAPRAQALCTGAADAIAPVWSPGRAHALQAGLGASETSATKDLVAQLDRWKGHWVSAHTETCQATHVGGAQSPQLLDARMLCLQHRAQETDALLRQLESGAVTDPSAAVSALAELPDIDRCADVDELSRRPVAPPAAEALRPALANARALTATGRYQDAVASLGPVVQSARDIGFAPVVAEAQLLLARATWKAGHAEQASEVGTEALLAAVAGRADVEAAEAWISLMGIAAQQGEYALAKSRARYAQAAVERLGSPGELRARLAQGLGVLLYNMEDYDRALESLSTALELRIARLGERHTLVASSHTSLGNLRRARGEYAAALEHHETALDIDTQILGGAHPNIGRHEHNIAGVLRLQGKAEQAIEHYRNALAIKTAALGAEHVDVALTNNSLGLMELSAGRLESAETYFASAETILAAAGHADRAVSAHNRGLVATALGDPARALEHYQRALEAYPAGSTYREALAAQIEQSRAALEPARQGKANSRPPRKGPAQPTGIGFGKPTEGVYAPTQTWD